jgi:hypothetical protein
VRRDHLLALMAAQLEAGDRASMNVRLHETPALSGPLAYVDRASDLLDAAEALVRNQKRNFLRDAVNAVDRLLEHAGGC